MRRSAAIGVYLTPIITVSALVGMVYRPEIAREVPGRIPEPAPYNVDEARFFPPPFEHTWETVHNPAGCASCHARIFEEWNGSMMSNAWRDPAWRAAFLLIARITATDGNCDVPEPPDGSHRAELNPFAVADTCSSRFDTAGGDFETARSGSLLDGFCSRCHMPTNYVDNIPLHQVEHDPETGLEHGRLRTTFDPTSDAGSGIAFTKAEAYFRNTDSGKRGIFCSVCHTMAESRDTPFHNFGIAGEEHAPALGTEARQVLLERQEIDRSATPPAPEQAHLGYGVGAGSFRLSPHAIGSKTFFGPLADSAAQPREDAYLSGVFGEPMRVEPGAFTEHEGFRHAKFERGEMCATCHDVTNPLPIKNALGFWVGGFPIERTYSEWLGSQYADRPGNERFDPSRKRDCQTCHMQQDFGQPGTANTLYQDGVPLAAMRDSVAENGPERSYFTHHFIGGNAYIPRLIGADVTATGAVEKYPKLSVFSFSSKDKKSAYSRAYWTDADAGRGQATQHARLAWDRLRNVVSLELEAPRVASPGARVPLRVRVANTGSGHKFPTGFPEGRVAWIAVRAFDLATGTELLIYDSHWDRSSLGVGYLTDRDVEDPAFPGCSWNLPAGSPDPYSYQLKAVASLGDGCPTLDLPYATPLNLVVDARGRPIDADGRVIDGDNPQSLPVFRDVDGDGDRYDDSFLVDTRLRPLPHAAASLELDRYAVVIPPEIEGPIAVVGGLYYQSLEAVVALKFLGNLADTDTDFHLEPCVLGGACDGREPVTEPAVVEGAPPVPMEVVEQVIAVAGKRDLTRPTVVVSPPHDATDVPRLSVVKLRFSEPVSGVDQASFTLRDETGAQVAAAVDRIGDGTWGLFPDAVFLTPGMRYTVRLEAGVCDAADNCLDESLEWSFSVAASPAAAKPGSTRVAVGFGRSGDPVDRPPAVVAVARTADGGIVVTFSEPVMNVTRSTLDVYASAGTECASPQRQVDGRLASDADGVRFTFTPASPLDAGGSYCVALSDQVYDLVGQGLAVAFRAPVPPWQEPTAVPGL